MTNKTLTKEMILEKIREVCGLNAEDWKWAKVAGINKAEEIKSLEIVGHPVHLEHLLLAIGAGVNLNTLEVDLILTPNKLWISNKGRPMNIDYNLTKSVEENLNNPELLKLIGELLNK